jgi:peptidoglycan/LPS O-acetylase OafA/YrhL
LYLSNWKIGLAQTYLAAPQLLRHTWSLGIEEQFYLLWPLFVWKVPADRLRRFCMIGILGGLFLRIGLTIAGVGGLALYLLTPTRLDALLVGALIAFFLRDDQKQSGYVPAVLAATVMGTIVMFLWRGSDIADPVVATVGYTLLALTFGALVVAASTNTGVVSRIFAFKPLRLAGKYSYAAYLFHPYLFVIVGRFGISSPWIQAAALTVVTYGSAAISWKFFEAPILTLKRYFPRSRPAQDKPHGTRLSAPKGGDEHEPNMGKPFQSAGTAAP